MSDSHVTPIPGIPASAITNGIADLVNHPSHYTSVVPGIECIDVTEHFSFLRGNAIKYLWRAGAKGDALTDLRKARWYIDREIANLEVADVRPVLCTTCGKPFMSDDCTHAWSPR